MCLMVNKLATITNNPPPPPQKKEPKQTKNKNLFHLTYTILTIKVHQHLQLVAANFTPISLSSQEWSDSGSHSTIHKAKTFTEIKSNLIKQVMK